MNPHLFPWPTLHIRLSSGLVAMLCTLTGCPLALIVGSAIVYSPPLQAVGALATALLLPITSTVLALFDCFRTRSGTGGISFLLSILSLAINALWAIVFYDLFLVRLY